MDPQSRKNTDFGPHRGQFLSRSWRPLYGHRGIWAPNGEAERARIAPIKQLRPPIEKVSGNTARKSEKMYETSKNVSKMTSKAPAKKHRINLEKTRNITKTYEKPSKSEKKT
jgi:hypothetical protein